jgi:hypothetical protein
LSSFLFGANNSLPKKIIDSGLPNYLSVGAATLPYKIKRKKDELPP